MKKAVFLPKYVAENTQHKESTFLCNLIQQNWSVIYIYIYINNIKIPCIFPPENVYEICVSYGSQNKQQLLP
jgi:hypothetical protein